jgi:hypothetical protein
MAHSKDAEIRELEKCVRAYRHFLHDYPAESLIERAVRGARARVAGPSPRWVAVMDTFGLGSTYAHDLCRKFGLDPDEEVRGTAVEG